MELDKVTDWLWCLRTETVQAYAIVDGEEIRLVDSSTAGEDDAILELLAGELGVRADAVAIPEIFLTHGHPDHTGSAAALRRRTGARLTGPAIDAPVIAGERPADPPQLLDWERPLFEHSMATVPPAEPAPLDAQLAPGDTLGWSRPTELLAAPGHTDGQLVVWFPDDRVLLAADAMASYEGVPMVGVFNVDPAVATTTFERLVQLPIETACFGHGAPVVGDAQARLREAVSGARAS